MAVTFTKKNVTWSFYENGATKESKSGKEHYPMYRLGSPMTERFMEELENKKYIRNKQFQKGCPEDSDTFGLEI